MRYGSTCFAAFFVAAFAFATAADAAIYRLVPAEADVLPGATMSLTAEVETLLGDNVEDIGFHSFAIDLGLSGSAGATGSNIGNVIINTVDFDDLAYASTGTPSGDWYIDISGVTTEIYAPTFGHNVGDVTWLFDFDITVPASASPGDQVIITPAEGSLDNLIANSTLDRVAPQTFESAVLTVVPEPTTGALLTLAALGLFSRRTRGRPGAD